MKKDSRIYVSGHCGFIGSALVRRLKHSGYQNLILNTHKELDLTDQKQTERLFKKEKPEYVFLFAARTGGIFANSAYPAQFIYDNLAIQTNVIHAAYKFGVKKLLFPGSSCMYPKFCRQPIKPEYLLTASIELTNEPFALAKISGIKLCQAYNRQYKTDFICVVPATVYGPADHFDANGHVVSGLIEKFYNAADIRGQSREVMVWGTGRPKREFIYIDDVVDALIFLMHKYSGSEIINIGTGEEFSIRSLAKKIGTITSFKCRIVYEKEKPDGIPRRLLDSSLIFSLGWRPKISLDKGIKNTYQWYKENKK